MHLPQAPRDMEILVISCWGTLLQPGSHGMSYPWFASENGDCGCPLRRSQVEDINRLCLCMCVGGGLCDKDITDTKHIFKGVFTGMAL